MNQTSTPGQKLKKKLKKKQQPAELKMTPLNAYFSLGEPAQQCWQQYTEWEPTCLRLVLGTSCVHHKYGNNYQSVLLSTTPQKPQVSFQVLCFHVFLNLQLVWSIWPIWSSNKVSCTIAYRSTSIFVWMDEWAYILELREVWFIRPTVGGEPNKGNNQLRVAWMYHEQKYSSIWATMLRKEWLERCSLKEALRSHSHTRPYTPCIWSNKKLTDTNSVSL